MHFLGDGRVPWQLLSALVVIVLLAFELLAVHALDTTEARLTDSFLRHHAAQFPADANIIIVDIDDASMQAMQEIAGLWAWPREIHADLLDALSEFAPRAVVFDIAFSERDLKHPKSDARLSTSLQAMAPHAYLAATLIDDTRTAGTPLRDLQTAFGVRKNGVDAAASALLLPGALTPVVWRLGLDNSVVDGDGVLRRYRIRQDVGGWRLPSLAARVSSDLGAVLPDNDTFLMSWPDHGRVRYSYGQLYRLLTEQRSAMADADVQQLDKLLRGKVIVIGSSATSSFDHHLTPLGASYPGVDVLATAIDNLLNRHEIQRPSAWWALLLGGVLIAALAWAFNRYGNPLYIGAALSLVSMLCLFAMDQAVARLWMLPFATPLIFAWIWFLSAAVAAFLRERRIREQAVSLFQRFLNPQVVKKIIDQGETVESMSGRTSEISVLFSDIRGFTTLSEMHDPQQVVQLLNRYFDRQVEVIFKHGGTLDKFIGDCIMAFWGAPIDDPHHAKHAVAAALEMEETLLSFQKELLAEDSDILNFDVGIGVHSGSAVVGFIGARRKLDYTAIGDTVNLASRVEGLTKGLGRVLVSRETMVACGDANDLIFELRGSFSVKGRAAEVELYEPKRR
jgi:adenylate cyclase